MEVFNGFQDFVETFYIHRGKVKSKSEEEETIVGEFKVMKLPEFTLRIVMYSRKG